jgi:cell division protein FtsQ
MYIDVEQRNPILKVYNKKDEVFNVDENGIIMPNNPEYPAYIRVANGNISAQNKNGDTAKNTLHNVLLLSQHINNIPFMDTLIEQLFVSDNSDIILIPNRGNVDILFGKIANMKNKIKKIEDFYSTIPSFNASGKYGVLDARFRDQIICINKY